MLNEKQIAVLGDELYGAWLASGTIPPLTRRELDISMDDAYQISNHFVNRRLAEPQRRIVGKKIGVTSDAVQSMLGVYEPDFGFLTDDMHVDSGEVSMGRLIQPRAEAEIAFRLKDNLMGPGVTPEDVLSATESVIACFEIVDSRIEQWQIAIQDTVADNASCGVFVLGEECRTPASLDLAACKVMVSKNGKPLSEGLGSSVQGSPLNSVAWLANTMGRLGVPLAAGEIVLSGSMVPLEPVATGDEMTMHVSGIGSATVRFVE